MNKEFCLINFLERISYLEEKFFIFLSDLKKTKNVNIETIKINKENLIDDFTSELIPIVDSFEMFSKSFDCNQSGESETMVIIFKLIKNFFKRLNIEQISQEKIKFDPLIHEAIGVYKGKPSEKGTIRSVLQSGYIRNNKLIRPALVIVNN